MGQVKGEPVKPSLGKGCLTTVFELTSILVVVAAVLAVLFFRAHPGTSLTMAFEQPALLAPMARNYYSVRLSPLDVQDVFLHPRAYEGARVSVRGVPWEVMGVGLYSTFAIDNGTDPSQRLRVLSKQVAPHEGTEVTVHGWIRHGATFGSSQTIFLCEFEEEPPQDILKAIFTGAEQP